MKPLSHEIVENGSFQGMDGSQQLKDDLRAGQIDGDRLVDLVATMQRQLQVVQRQLDVAQRRIAELEKLVPDVTERLKLGHLWAPQIRPPVSS